MKFGEAQASNRGTRWMTVLLVTVLLLAGCGQSGQAKKKESVSTKPTVTTQAVPAKASETPPVKPSPKEVVPPAPQAKFIGGGMVAPDEVYIVVDKSDFKLYVNRGMTNLATYGCATGQGVGQKQKTGDMRTPTGMFPLAEIDDASYWEHDFGDGKGSIKGAYGPWFLYLDTSQLSKGQWDGIGIHGTHDPASIGTRASEGCIRLRNEHIAELKEKYAKVGMKVFIQE